jgi:outer membrane protein assembly factor BamB
MSDETQTKSAGARLWPALIIVAAQLTVSYGFTEFGSTNIHSVIGNIATPVIGLIALLLWWLFASRVAWRDKIAGVALFTVAVVLILTTQKNQYYGGILLSVALPILTSASVVAMLLTASLGWNRSRLAAAAVLILCTLGFLATRVVTVSSDFVTVTEWRLPLAKKSGGMALAKPGIEGSAVLPAAAAATDWPGFRGPGRDGRATGVSFSTDWNTPPRQLWRRPIGPGHSALTIVGDYVFTQEQAGGDELVSCYSAKTGEAVWTNSVATKHDDTMGGEGPRATPTYANGKLYAQSAGGLLQCLDAATGKALWTAELTTPASPKPPMYGFASSPLVHGDLVIQYSSGAGRNDMFALNANTGAEVWSAAKNTGGYGSPHLATLDGVQQVLLLNSDGIQSYEPAQGAKIWEHVWPKKEFPRCVQPVLDDAGGIALGANTDFGTRLVRAKKGDTGWTVAEEWTNKKHRPYFNDNIGHKGYLYGFDGNRLCCVDLKTGEHKWQGPRCGGQVMVVVDMDMLLVLTEKGKVLLVKADPAEYAEVASFDALQGKTWNHPSIANGKLYVRNSDEAACYELSAQ